MWGGCRQLAAGQSVLPLVVVMAVTVMAMVVMAVVVVAVVVVAFYGRLSSHAHRYSKCCGPQYSWSAALKRRIRMRLRRWKRDIVRKKDANTPYLPLKAPNT